MRFLLCLLVLILLASVKGLSVSKHNRLLFDELKEVSDDAPFVQASYKPALSTSDGWGELTIDVDMSQVESKEDLTDAFYKMGLLEGYLSCEDMQAYFVNAYAATFGDEEVPGDVSAFLLANYEWSLQQAKEKAAQSPYWLQTLNTWSQMSGMMAGFDQGCPQHPSYSLEKALIVLGYCDIWDLMLKFGYYTLDGKAGEGKLGSFNHVPRRQFLGKFGQPHFVSPVTTSSRCSAIVKPLFGDAEGENAAACLEDVQFGHTTWDTYATASPRILKTYSFPVWMLPPHLTFGPLDQEDAVLDEPLLRRGARDQHPPSLFSALFNPRGQEGEIQQVQISLSSSPGLLMASLDDFYLQRSRAWRKDGQWEVQSLLGVQETTNGILNMELYDQVSAESNLCWLRSQVANAIARDGVSWSKAFSYVHSGTYLNQWMVVDGRVFHAYKEEEGKQLNVREREQKLAGLYTVLEEIPGYVESHDLTSTLLDQQYWPSYNVPFYANVSTQSGFKQACTLMGEGADICYDSCPRANIFRARETDVVDLSGVQSILEYNDWQNDPLSEGSPSNAISARGDLEKASFNLWIGGGMDSKATSLSSLVEATFGKEGSDGWMFRARMGPTHAQQPVFCWDQVSPENEVVHENSPACFDYAWMTYRP